MLAGDIGSYQPGSQLAGDDFGLERFSPRLGWPMPVLYVPGNHEYDNLDFDAAHARLRDTCERLGITWLEREVLVLRRRALRRHHAVGRFRRAGDASDPPRQPGAAAAQARQGLPRRQLLPAARPAPRGAASRCWPRAGASRRWSARTGCARRWPEPFDGTTVVVTHFAPSLRSADPRYGLTPGTAGLLQLAGRAAAAGRLWLHGHLHCQHDYVAGGCRVVANTLGYARKGEQEGFREHLLIEVPGCMIRVLSDLCRPRPVLG